MNFVPKPMKRKTIISLIAIVAIASVVMFSGCVEEKEATGVEFASKEHFEFSNTYQDMLSITLTAPSSGYVVLTGSGYFKILGGTGAKWASVSIGTISGGANTENEIGVNIPTDFSATYYYDIPFSHTCVIPVSPGDNHFYMVGIKDPNPHAVYANGLKLTAVFVPTRL